jgi:hypothetical protein
MDQGVWNGESCARVKNHPTVINGFTNLIIDILVQMLASTHGQLLV